MGAGPAPTVWAAGEMCSQNGDPEDDDPELVAVLDSSTKQHTPRQWHGDAVSLSDLQALKPQATAMVEMAFEKLASESVTPAMRQGIFDYFDEDGLLFPQTLRKTFEYKLTENLLRERLANVGAPNELVDALKRVVQGEPVNHQAPNPTGRVA